MTRQKFKNIKTELILMRMNDKTYEEASSFILNFHKNGEIDAKEFEHLIIYAKGVFSIIS